MFKFRPERLHENTLLGRGASGEVFPYQKDPQDQRWVVKRILAKNMDDLLHCLEQVVLGFACDHPCVVPVKGYFVDKVPNSKYLHVYMKTPRMKETLFQNFKDRKSKSNPYSEQEIIQHFYSLACGIKYLHNKKIYHRDIRHDNLMLDNQGNLKITDIGLTKQSEEEDFFSQSISTGQKGLCCYSTPKILNLKAKKEQLAKADIWSLGIVILELCTFNFDLLDPKLSHGQLQGKVYELLGSLEKKYKKELVDLIKKLLTTDPKERPDVGQVKDYLEKNFSESINKEVFNLENSYYKCHPAEVPIQKNPPLKKEDNKAEGQIAGMILLLSYLYEKGSRKGEITTQLENSFALQKNQYISQIQVLTEEINKLKDDCERLQDTINKKDEQSKILEERVRILMQEKISEEQRSNEIEKYIGITIKEQAKAYEAQIKELQEAQHKEKVQFEQEKIRLLKDLNDLRLKWKPEMPKVEGKRESLDQDYGQNLKRATEQLKEKWSPIFTFHAYGKMLLINSDNKTELTDEKVSLMSKDVIETIGENSLLNLWGLQFAFAYAKCQQLTDEVIKGMVETACTLQKLEFFSFGFNSSKITFDGISNLACQAQKSCQNLREIGLILKNCPQITQQMQQELKQKLASIPRIYLIGASGL